MRILVAILSLIALPVVAAPKTVYIDPAATGANNGTSWANAYTTLASVARDSGNISPGDTAILGGGTYTDGDLSLERGTAGNWITYQTSQEAGHNSEVVTRGRLAIGNYTKLSGAKVASYETNFIGTAHVLTVTNNCNWHVDRSTNWYGVGSGGRSIQIVDGQTGPFIVEWMHLTGTEDKGANEPPGYTKSDSPSEIFYDGGTTSTTNIIRYNWIDKSSGWGSSAFITIAYPGTTFGVFDIHHNLLENGWSDGVNMSAGVDFHHNIIRRRGWPGSYAGCNDTFTISGNTSYIRIHHNMIEPADNTLIYLWGSVSNCHDFYFYNNLLMPVRLGYYGIVGYSQGAAVMEQDVYWGDYHLTSNNVFALNTWVGTTNHGPSGLINLVSKNANSGCAGSNMVIETSGLVIKDNLFCNVDTNQIAATTPLTLWSGANTSSKGWVYDDDNDSIVLDYNGFYEYVSGNMRPCSWGTYSSPVIIVTNTAYIPGVTGYTHNQGGTLQAFTSPHYPDYDYHPASPSLIGAENLTGADNMPDVEKDLDGITRPASGAWTMGAYEYTALTNGLLLHLTFDLDDGWPANHIITDRSPSGTNHAYYYASTAHSTWPTWVAGPGNLNAAQFVVNYTNGFRYGTYAVITNVFGPLKSFTQGTWSLWAWVDDNHIATDSDDIFLGTSQDEGNWFFGKYYADGPLFAAPTTMGGQEPLRAHTRWPDVTTGTGWRHYAITWDGTYWTAYTNGQYFGDMLSWTNDGNYAYTTYTTNWSGTLVSTNTVGVGNSWIAVGVNPHSGTPNPDDGDGLPNNGQYWGRLADVRIYNRALSAQEIQAIYQFSGVTPAGGDSGPVYYVSPTGDDGNDGLTLATPWTMSKGLLNLAPDVTVKAMDGNYPGPVIIDRIAGTAGHPWTLQSLNKWGAIITNSASQGIRIDSDAGTQTQYGIIDGFWVTNAVNNAIAMGGNMIIRNCKATGGAATTESLYTLFPITNGGVFINGGVIEDCIAENAGQTLHHGFYYAGGMTVRRCISRNNSGFGFHNYTGSDSYTNTGCITENCLSYGNTSKYGIAAWNADGDDGSRPGTNYFYNCTLLDGIEVAYGAARITNCIILNSPQDTSNAIHHSPGRTCTVTADYNMSTNSLAPDNGAHDVTGDPLFVGGGDYRLTSGSGAISAAVDLSSQFTTDLLGTTRPQGAGWDIGAYEFIGSPAGGGSAGTMHINGPAHVGQIRTP